MCFTRRGFHLFYGLLGRISLTSVIGPTVQSALFFLGRNPQQCTIYITSKNLFSASVQVEWTRDLPNLRLLHLTKMPQLRSLDTDFRSMPHLRELNCRDSHSLGFVRTEMFESTPNLSHLSFQKWVVFFFVVLHQSLLSSPRTTARGADLCKGCLSSYVRKRYGFACRGETLHAPRCTTQSLCCSSRTNTAGELIKPKESPVWDL